MREELLESEAIELPADDEAGAEQPAARPLPAAREDSEISAWRGEMRSAALAAAGGIVAGAATVAVVRASRSVAGAGRKPARRRTKERPVKVVASRSFMVDVHLLGDR